MYLSGTYHQGDKWGFPQHFFCNKSFCEVCMKKLTFHEVAPPPYYFGSILKNYNEIRKFRENMEFKVDYATPSPLRSFLLIWRVSVFSFFLFFVKIEIAPPPPFHFQKRCFVPAYTRRLVSIRICSILVFNKMRINCLCKFETTIVTIIKR